MNFLFVLTLLTIPLQQVRVVEWLTPVQYEFGDIHQGRPAATEFRFKNISSVPFTIDNVRTSCSCTASEWDETTIPPGGEGHIKIKYDARRPGHFRKKITVFFSTQRKAEKLYVSGYVE
ncbi:MAG TPA: DUF1573 domain-containing protein [Bacteroidetes bacterium]|nr:DUF1573 domain-containing protein [Bacteroidota bacterium]